MSDTYTAFGKAAIEIETIENNLRFPGQYFDAETGLHYNNQRYYDPETGRYTQPDPLGFGGGDVNWYAYVGNDPIRYADPYGQGSLNFIEAWFRYNLTKDVLLTPPNPVFEGINDAVDVTHQVATTTSTVAVTAADVGASLVCEPYDWGRTFYGWTQGEFSYWDLAGLLPVLSATSIKHIDEILEKANRFPTQDWLNWDKVNEYIQRLNDGETLEPIEVIFNPQKNKTYILDGHHKYVASEITGIPVKEIQTTGPVVGADSWKIVDIE